MSLASPARLCDLLPHKAPRLQPASAVYGADRLEYFERITAMLEASDDGAACDLEFGDFTLNPNLHETFLEFCVSRLLLLYGGRGSSKSHEVASIIVAIAACFTVKVMVLRAFDCRIQDSIFALLEAKAKASPWRVDFEFLKNGTAKNTRTGSTFISGGLALNTEQLKSTEGVSILLLEEAQALTKDQYTLINATVRQAGSKVIAIWNPDAITDFVQQGLAMQALADTCKREVNWWENPFLSRTMMKLIYEGYNNDPEDSIHVYSGAPKTSGTAAFISYKHLLACVDAHLKLPELDWESGPSCVGFDISDGQGDALSTTRRRGSVIKKIAEWHDESGKLFKSTERAFKEAAYTGSLLCFDTCGLGKFIGEHCQSLSETTKLDVRALAFDAGGQILDKDKSFREFPSGILTNGQAFANPKAQAWRMTETRIRNTYAAIKTGRKFPVDQLISFDSKSIGATLLNKALLELSTPLRETRNGKEAVESKDKLKRRGIPSHNIADSVVLATVARSNLDKEYVGFFDSP